MPLDLLSPAFFTIQQRLPLTGAWNYALSETKWLTWWPCRYGWCVAKADVDRKTLLLNVFFPLKNSKIEPMVDHMVKSVNQFLKEVVLLGAFDRYSTGGGGNFRISFKIKSRRTVLRPLISYNWKYLNLDTLKLSCISSVSFSVSISSTVSTWLSSIVSFLDMSVENINIEKKSQL